MANSPQAKKRARQNERRFAVNKARRSRIRTYLEGLAPCVAREVYRSLTTDSIWTTQSVCHRSRDL